MSCVSGDSHYGFRGFAKLRIYLISCARIKLRIFDLYKNFVAIFDYHIYYVGVCMATRDQNTNILGFYVVHTAMSGPLLRSIIFSI